MELLPAKTASDALRELGNSTSFNEWDSFFQRIGIVDPSLKSRLITEIDWYSYSDTTVYPPIGFVGKSEYNKLSHPQKIAIYEFLMSRSFKFQTKEYHMQMKREMIKDAIFHPVATWKMLFGGMPPSYIQKMIDEEEGIDGADLVRVVEGSNSLQKVVPLIEK